MNWGVNMRLYSFIIITLLIFASSILASSDINTTNTSCNYLIYTQNNTVNHPNGQVLTNNTGDKNATWYYENGQVLSHSIANVGSTWYWPNGQVLSHSIGNQGATWYSDSGNTIMFNGPELSEQQLFKMACNMVRSRSKINPLDYLSDSDFRKANRLIDSSDELVKLPRYVDQCQLLKNGDGQSLYYSNGKVITNTAGLNGATIYYDNGQVLTNNMGEAGSTWYWRNGKVISHNMGNSGSTWYYEDGKVKTHDSVSLNEKELYNLACHLLKIR